MIEKIKKCDVCKAEIERATYTNFSDWDKNKLYNNKVYQTTNVDTYSNPERICNAALHICKECENKLLTQVLYSGGDYNRQYSFDKEELRGLA